MKTTLHSLHYIQLPNKNETRRRSECYFNCDRIIEFTQWIFNQIEFIINPESLFLATPKFLGDFLDI